MRWRREKSVWLLVVVHDQVLQSRTETGTKIIDRGKQSSPVPGCTPAPPRSDDISEPISETPKYLGQGTIVYFLGTTTASSGADQCSCRSSFQFPCGAQAVVDHDKPQRPRYSGVPCPRHKTVVPCPRYSGVPEIGSEISQVLRRPRDRFGNIPGTPASPRSVPRYRPCSPTIFFFIGGITVQAQLRPSRAHRSADRSTSLA